METVARAARGTPAARKQILVVEDERLVARDLQLKLEDLGYEVPATVASSEQAIEEADARRPDLILMDIRIKGRQDGIETADVIRRRFDIPFVYLTAHSDDETLARAGATGACGYLVKPLKPNDLRSTIAIAFARHEMTRQLRERERRYLTTLRSIGDGVISTDASGSITFMNPVAEAVTGWRMRDAVGRPLREVFQVTYDATGRSGAPIDDALRDRAVVHVHGVMTTSRGTTVEISDSAAPIVDADGHVIGGVIVFRDISAHALKQRQLEAAERAASLHTLVAGVAHEVNNPLTSILANTDHVRETLRDELSGAAAPAWLPEALEDLDAVERGARRIQRVVADLGVFDRVTPTGQVTDVAEAVRHAVSATADMYAGQVAVSTAVESPACVAIDDHRLQQVLVNLLRNAAHAVSGRARARVAVRARQSSSETIEIEVTDTGIGMTEAVKSRAFEPFFSTRPPGQGKGLGLASARAIIHAAGGTIEVESAPEVGSTFRIRVPAAAPPAPSAGTPLTGGRILLVDDDEMLRRSVVRVLSQDHVVTQTAGGTRAVELVAAGQRFDVILCDIVMPDMDGIDVLKRLRELSPAQAERLVFMTGGGASIDSSELAGMTVLEKPAPGGVLRDVIRQRLEALGPLEED